MRHCTTKTEEISPHVELSRCYLVRSLPDICRMRDDIVAISLNDGENVRRRGLTLTVEPVRSGECAAIPGASVRSNQGLGLPACARSRNEGADRRNRSYRQSIQGCVIRQYDRSNGAVGRVAHSCLESVQRGYG